VRSCCAYRRTLLCEGTLLGQERRRSVVTVLQECDRASDRLVCGWWVSATAPSATAASSPQDRG
jgi:hypothetical protein